jgi:hypothetical protein
MAELSKQWCEIWEPSMPHSFDIEAITRNMYRDRYYPIVCEGFGFNCIHKDAHGIIWLSFGIDSHGNSTTWKRYRSIITEELQKAANNESSSIQRHP